MGLSSICVVITMASVAAGVPGCYLALMGDTGAELSLADDFSKYPETQEPGDPWMADGYLWEVRSGALYVAAPMATGLVLRQPRWFKRVRIQATVTVQETTTSSWKAIGLAIIHDNDHLWRAALVEAPDHMGKKHFFGLHMRLPGVWPCLDGVKVLVDEAGDFDWQYNHPYRIVLELGGGKIEARLEEIDGTVRSHKVYRLSEPAVQDGSPALRCNGFRGVFDDVKIAAAGYVGSPLKMVAKYPPLDVPTIRRIRGRKTGFFHVEKMDGVWWVISPNGQGFYAIGTDHVRYAGHWCQKLGYAPYGKNTKALYGSEERWAEVATARLRRWNFNLLGAGHSPSCRYRGLAHTVFGAFGSAYAALDPLVKKEHWTGFPNVFSPNWPRWCNKQAWRICRPHRDDPWLFGYFLDNELEWWGKGRRAAGLAIEAAKLLPDNPAKIALIDLLKKRHGGSIDALNHAWGANYASWDELARATEFEAKNANALRRDQLAYVALAADLYFKHCTEAIRRHDPNHMILGCRFAGDAPPGVWEAAGRYCDIVTFNYYGRVDVLNADAPGIAHRWTTYYEKACRPLMITEWSFPALDSGLPCTYGAGMRVDTQARKALCYEVYQRLILSLPFIVGSDYFMWVDEPAPGISETFPGDGNYGLVNEKDEPYELLTRTATRVNAMAYELHSGDAPEIEVRQVAERAGRVGALVANTGRRAARFELQFVVNGRAAERAVVRLRPGQDKRVTLSRPPRPPAYITVAADPERTLPERDLKNNRAEMLYYKPAPWLEPPSAAKKWLVRWPVVITAGTAPIEPGTVLTVAADDLKKFGPAEKIASRLAAYDLEAREVPCQLEPWEDGWQVALAAPQVPANSGTVLCIYLADSPPQTQAAASLSPFAGPQWSFDNGPLNLEGTGQGNVVDRISLRGTLLGRLNLLVWERRARQDLWVQSARTEKVTAFRGPVGLAVEVKCASLPQEAPITAVDHQGKTKPPQTRPHHFTVVGRIHLPIGRPWLVAELRSITNADREPMEIRGWDYYLLSFIGGDVKGDELGGPGVPNYWLCLGAWKDEAVGLTVGELAVPDGRIWGGFWVDKGGRQHPNLRRSIDPPMILHPGRTFVEKRPPQAVVFAGPIDSKPWQEAARVAAALYTARLCLLSAERP